MKKFIVEVQTLPQGDLSAHKEALALAFKIGPEKVDVLLGRLPGAVTKSVSESVAREIAGRFERLGFQAAVRPKDERGRLLAPISLTSTAPPRAVASPQSVTPVPATAGAADVISAETRRGSESTTPAPVPSTPTNEPTRPLPEILFTKPPTSKTPPETRRASRLSPPVSRADTPSSAKPKKPTLAEPEPPTAEPPTAEPAATESPAAEPPIPKATVIRPPAATTEIRRDARETVRGADLPFNSPIRSSLPAGHTTMDIRESTWDVASTTILEPDSAEDAPYTKDNRSYHRGSLFNKLLTIALIPTLLAVIGALAVTWVVVRPALYEQLLDSARNPAIAAAASLSSALSGDEDLAPRLLETIQIARQTFPRESVGFIVATDTQGVPLSAMFEGVQGFDPDNRELETAIRDQALLALTNAAPGSDEIEVLGEDAVAANTSSVAMTNTTQHLSLRSGESFEIVAQPLLRGGAPIGTIVVGVTDAAVTRKVSRILLSILLLSLIPLALAALFAYNRARALSHTILSLTQRADEISRGKLEKRADMIRSNDELDDLAQAVERLRVSMSEAMARLRRTRNQ